MNKRPSRITSVPLCASLALACGPEASDPESDPAFDETTGAGPSSEVGDSDLRPTSSPQATPGFESECFTCDAVRDDCASECGDDREHCVLECESCEPTTGPCKSVEDCTKACEEVQGTCTTKCETIFGDCWEVNECDGLSDDCEFCIQDCNAQCVDEPEDGREACVTACESFQDHCWASFECDGPYSDRTPICNYLDRGIDDFQTGQIDFYEVVAPGIKTVADIHKLEFGLDLPGTNCAAGLGIPCADKDYATKWSFDEIALLVKGVPLFHAEKGADDPWLALVGGGTGDAGISGWTLAELTANPFWGLSENEIGVFFTQLPLPNGLASPSIDDIAMGMQPMTLSGSRVRAIVEGSIGQVLAQTIKTGAGSDTACAGEIYCDNARDYQVAWRGTYHAGTADCDFGGCPNALSRMSSPWLEVRGHANRLTVNADLEIIDGRPDDLDCPDGGILCGEPNGTNYKWLADIGVTLELRAICTGAPGGTKSIRLDLDSIDVELEDGSTLVNLAEDYVTAILDGQVEQTVLDVWQAVPFIEGLDACPESFAEFALDGEFSFELEVEGVCMPPDQLPGVVVCGADDDCENGFGCVQGQCVVGAGTLPERDCTNNECPGGYSCTVGTGRAMDPAQYVRWARTRHQPAGSAAAALEAAYERHVAEIPLDKAFVWTVAADIIGPAAPTVKAPFHALTSLEAPICALVAGFEVDIDDDGTLDYVTACAPDLDLAAVELPPPNVSPGGLAFTCDPAIAPGNAANDEACEQLAKIKAFVMQPEIYQKCLLHQVPPFITPDDAVLAEVWAAFEAVVEGCEAAVIPFENFVPTPGLDLTLQTGTFPGTDTFPFVDLTDADQLRESVHAAKKCRNRIDLDPIEPYDYPGCDDSEAASTFGLEGCPCADIDVLDFDEILADGGYPDGAGSFAAHGLDGPGQYCEDDEKGELVCGRVRHQGRDFPVCMRCHEDTKVGCDCQESSDCAGLEEGLVCVGSSAEEGWIGGVLGQCLPDPGLLEGQEALEETRWFCLDNCDSIDANGGAVGACYFNQHSAQVDHGTCINTLNECGAPSPGVCEEGGDVCRENGDGVEVCEPECDASTDCADLGFPPHFVCDDFSPGHCVPPECADTGAIWSFCELYR